MDDKTKAFERDISRAEFDRPPLPDTLDRSVLAYARNRNVSRRWSHRLIVTVMAAAAAMMLAFGVVFMEHGAAPSSEPQESVRPVSGSELASLWDWNSLENETLELSAAAEYSRVAIASL